MNKLRRYSGMTYSTQLGSRVIQAQFQDDGAWILPANASSPWRVAMAGDVVRMSRNGMLMLHDPSGLVMGTAADMRGMAEAPRMVPAGAPVDASSLVELLRLRARLQGTGVSVSRVGDTITLQMPSNITFALNSADLNSQFYSVLDGVNMVLKEYDKTVVEVAGHPAQDGVGEIAPRILREIQQFERGAHATDDKTIVVVRRQP